MSAPEIYKSTDANAPVLHGVAGSLVSLLRAVCVTGYGDKTALGWSEISAGNNKIVLSHDVYNGMNQNLCRFDDDLSSYSYKKTIVSLYESMSDINTGVGKTGDNAIFKSVTSDATARPWIIIGDAYGAYIFTDFASTGYYECNYIGAGNSIFSDDKWFNLLCGGTEAASWIAGSAGWTNVFSAVATQTYGTGGSSGVYRAVRKRSGGIDTINTPLSLYFMHPSSSTIFGGGGGDSEAYPTDGKLIVSAPILNNGIAASVRGYLPGFYNHRHTTGLTAHTVYPDGAHQYYCMPIMYYDSTQTFCRNYCMIDIGEGFRP